MVMISSLPLAQCTGPNSVRRERINERKGKYLMGQEDPCSDDEMLVLLARRHCLMSLDSMMQR